MNYKSSEGQDVKNWYLSKFEKFETSLNGDKELAFHNVRKDAIDRFAELGFPTQRIEEWKYTNIKPLLQHQFGLAKETVELSGREFSQFKYDGMDENLIVFVNGLFSEKFSHISQNGNGIHLSTMKQALRANSGTVNRYLSKRVYYENEAFAALNTAFTTDGVYISVPDNTIVEAPIHVLNISVPSEEGFQCHPRNLFVIGKRSQVRIVESHEHLADHPYLQNAVTEIIAGEGSVVDHIKIQDESKEAFRIANTVIEQDGGSVFTSVSIDLGGNLVRNTTTLNLNGENCESHLFGFYQVSGRQHIDNHTNINHLQPHCDSNELYKGILSGTSRGVFSGTIYVAKDAQKTNAFQSNKNLLLSNQAEIDTKPQLKIFADDVKCSHGATIGQLDEEALFYFRQRGINADDARGMLRYAFAADVFDKIKIPAVRERLDNILKDRLINDI